MPEEFDPANGPTSRTIPHNPVPGDWIADHETGIPYEENEVDGQWNKPGYLPTDTVVQYATYFDTDACTDYACANSLTIQCRRHLIKGNLSSLDMQKLMDAGFIVNGEFQRLDPHFNAILAGTKWGIGNYGYKPWDAARHYGMIPMGKMPFPQTQKQPYYGPTDYYNTNLVTDELKQFGQIFLDVFEVRYEILPACDPVTIANHRRQAPICIDTGVCSPWNAGPVPVCNLTNGHFTVDYGEETGLYSNDLDSYIPNQKELAWGYHISFALKGVALVKSQVAETPQILPFQYQWTIPLQFGQTSSDIKALQDYLKTAGFFPMTVPSSGFYGNVTVGAVLKFQQYYSVANSILLKIWAGHFVGPSTLPVLNTLCNANP